MSTRYDRGQRPSYKAEVLDLTVKRIDEEEEVKPHLEEVKKKVNFEDEYSDDEETKKKPERPFNKISLIGEDFNRDKINKIRMIKGDMIHAR